MVWSLVETFNPRQLHADLHVTTHSLQSGNATAMCRRSISSPVVCIYSFAAASFNLILFFRDLFVNLVDLGSSGTSTLATLTLSRLGDATHARGEVMIGDRCDSIPHPES